MRNLNPFSGETSDFLDEVISSKRNSKKDPDYKERINALLPALKVHYTNYDTIHDTNKHVSLISTGYQNQNKADLLKLYSSDNSRLVKLKNSVTTIYDNRAMNTCQYCTITPIGSLDHIVPKNEFPEFSVNPKNLLPACTTCNSHKGENWKARNKTIFLNLYTDILPNEQYLFVNLEISDDNIQPTFELRNVNNINVDFFELIESHYTRLHLLRRFKDESHKIISELTNLLSASSIFLNREQIIQIIETKIIEDKSLYGNNYYKSILEQGLIDNIDFLNSVGI